MVGHQEHFTIATWRHPFHHQWRPSSQSDDASGPNPPPRHVSGQLQGAPHDAVREVGTEADSAESVDSQPPYFDVLASTTRRISDWGEMAPVHIFARVLASIVGKAYRVTGVYCGLLRTYCGLKFVPRSRNYCWRDSAPTVSHQPVEKAGYK